MLSSPVAVGIADGQDLDIVRVALGEARRLDRSLRVVRVVESSAVAHPRHEPTGHDLQDLLESVRIERVTRCGDAEAVLLAESREACRLVLGAEGPAHWSAVVELVALRATVPVVVVPTASATSAAAAHVLVAVDSAQSFDGQLAYGFEAAEEQGVSLTVVYGAGTMSDHPGRLQHARRLEELLDPWRSRHPAVHVDVVVEGGHPVEACLRAADHASLMIVGRPACSHPRLSSRSVAARIVRGAGVPVAVVPLDHAASRARVLVPH